MNLPTKEECFELLKKYDVPSNVINHMKLVTKIAVFLAKRLKEKRIDIHLELVEYAALLHDIDKIITLKKTGEHGKISKKILAEEGFPELGEIIEVHGVKGLIECRLNTWEKKIVNYADKRVIDDKMADVDERFDDLIKRYKGTIPKKNFEKTRKLVKDVEKQIFSHLDFKPEELEEKMKNRKV